MSVIWEAIVNFVEVVWPIIVFVIAYPIFKSTWMFWRQAIYKKSIKWVLLELHIPREIKKSAQGMEQIFAAIHALRNAPGNLMEWYWAGEVTEWKTFEMVSFGGEVHFYVRTKVKQKGLVEAAILSYYPDIEVVETEDYIDKLPVTVKEMYDQGYEMWGSEMLTNREGCYPIKTYDKFHAVAEEKEYDPISEFLEVLGKIKREEIVGIQISAAPADFKWYEEYEPLIQKLKEPKMKKQERITGEGQLESFARMIARSPGETDVLEEIEKNLSKPAFDTMIRFIYLSPKTTFYDSFARRGLTGAFNQYAALDLNSFRQNYTISTRTMIWYFPYLFPKRRNDYRKMRLLYTYRNRYWPPKPLMGRIMTSYILNWNFASKSVKLTTQCLATIFHPPTYFVLTAPHIARVPSRKASPPAGLAIFGDEEAIEKFM